MSNNRIKAAWLEALLEAAVDAILTIDRHGIIQTANASAETLFGHARDEMVGYNISRLMPEPWSKEHDTYIRNYLETGEAKIIGTGREVTGQKKDGTHFPLHLSVNEFRDGEEVFFCGILHDLTARKTSERALKISQRLEAIGQLSGGVAHDFNNLLTVIIGNLELLEHQIEEPQQSDMLREALEAAELGADLTNRLLAFAKRGILRPKVVDINVLIDDLSGILRRTLGSQIAFDASLADGLWRTLADPGQVETALLNLVVNARDAMPQGGSLIIETSNAVLDREHDTPQVDVEPGDYIRVSVTDTGTGMPDLILQKVFEPFFTTKKASRGTGLGLSMVYGFARQSGGTVTIYSENGIGTTVNLYLPRHDGRSSGISRETDCAPARSYLGSGELVLVVEDDARVRKLTLQRLEVLNYRTIVARDGKEALGLLRDKNGHRSGLYRSRHARGRVRIRSRRCRFAGFPGHGSPADFGLR